MGRAITQEIERAIRELELSPDRVSAVERGEADALVSEFLRRFVDEPSRTWWWEGFKVPYVTVDLGEHDRLSCLIGALPNSAEEVFLLSTPDDEPEISVFRGAAGDLLRVLEECYPFEYVLLHSTFAWFVCESHHDQIFGAGEPISSALRSCA